MASLVQASGIFNPGAGGNGGSATLPLPAGATNYIQNTSSLQSGATFYVSSGTTESSGGTSLTVINTDNGDFGTHYGINLLMKHAFGSPTTGYGIYSKIGTQGLTDYALYGDCTGINSTVCYALYGAASGSGTNYGLFIAAGQAQINSSMTVAGAGLRVVYGVNAATGVFQAASQSANAFVINDPIGNNIARVDNSTIVSTNTLFNVNASTGAGWAFGVSTNTDTGPWIFHVSSATITDSQALCLLNGTLGHCTSVVGVGGGCTCVSP